MLHRSCRARHADQSDRIVELYRSLNRRSEEHDRQVAAAVWAEAERDETEMAHRHLLEEITLACAHPGYVREADIPTCLRQALLEREELRSETYPHHYL